MTRITHTTNAGRKAAAAQASIEAPQRSTAETRFGQVLVTYFPESSKGPAFWSIWGTGMYKNLLVVGDTFDGAMGNFIESAWR